MANKIQINEKWRYYREKVNAGQLRSRLILLVIILAAIYGVWYLFLYLPMTHKTHQLVSQLHLTKNQLVTLQGRARKIQQKIEKPHDTQAHAQYRQLQTMVKRLGDDLVIYQRKIIPYKHLLVMLKNALHEHKGLTLVRLESQPPKVVYNGDHQKLLQYNIVLELKGTYLPTLRFIQQLAAMPWRFFWDGLWYKVTRYPHAQVILKIHTFDYERNEQNG